MRKSGLALLLALILCSCATQYGEQGFSGGYTDSRIDDTHYIVSFEGNGLTDGVRVWNYWMYRCAEITQEHGYAYFSTQMMKTNDHSKAIVSFYNDPHEAKVSFVLNAKSILDDLGPYVKGKDSSALVPQGELIRRALTFTPDSIVAPNSHLDATLPAGWEKKPLTVAMIESGGVLFATNEAMGAGMTLTALRREKVGDGLAFTEARRTLFTTNLIGAEASDVATLDLGGRRAWQFDATGTVSSGQKMTFVITIIEGDTEIALLNRWMSDSAYADNKGMVADLGSIVIGFSTRNGKLSEQK